MKILS